MIDAKLVNVAPSQVFAVRLFEGDDVPSWVPDPDANGILGVRRWRDGHVMVDVTVGIAGESHAVRVTLTALYKVDADVLALPEEELKEFAHSHVEELMPFMRQAVFTASSQVWPVKPIMINLDLPGSGGESPPSGS